MTATTIENAARLSVAPMMDWTDRHCRFFHRLMSRHTRLYTEMVTAPALVRGDARHLLRFHQSEHPIAVQLGGSEPEELAEAARMAEAEGYDEVNLNVGCPSDRVQSGAFGAILMKDPALVATCLGAMRAAVNLPVTVKCRIGVDDQLPSEILPDFLTRVRDVGVTQVTVHARKAWLEGLSPKENRDIPPLDYDLVFAMKARFPDLSISLNGGVATLAEARGFLDRGMDGVMIGRAAYSAPWDILGMADPQIFGTAPPFQTPDQVAMAMLPYIEAHLAEDGRLNAVTRHMLGLFSGRPGARAWRRFLSENAHVPGAGCDVILAALDGMNVRAAG